MTTQITNAAQLKAIEDNMNGHYLLMNDINLGGANFEPIGHGSLYDYTPFTGTFDGQGFKIYNGEINYPSDSYIGLFAYLVDAEVKNVTVDLTITGNDFVGGIAGRVDQQIPVPV